MGKPAIRTLKLRQDGGFEEAKGGRKVAGRDLFPGDMVDISGGEVEEITGRDDHESGFVVINVLNKGQVK